MNFRNFICKQIFDPGVLPKWTTLTFWFLLYFCGVVLLSSSISGLNAERLLPPAFEITKEDTRFAAMRCQQDYAAIDSPNETQNAENRDLRSLWKQYVYPNDTQTHCFVKCFLSKLGLIDLHTLGLDGDRLQSVWRHLHANYSCVHSMKIDQPLSGRCISYYRKFMRFHRVCPELAHVTFFEYQPLYEIGGKPFLTTAMDYCNSLIAQTKLTCKGSSCSSLVCVFTHCRYFDAYGRLDEKEIQLSFREAKLATPTNVKEVKRCTHRGNSKFIVGKDSHEYMAKEFDRCLKDATDDYVDVLVHLNEVTRFY